MIKTVEKNNIIADFQRGLGNKTIAKTHGHSRTTIIKFRKAYNEAIASDNPDAALTELIRRERIPSKRNRKHPKLTEAIRDIIDADLDVTPESFTAQASRENWSYDKLVATLLGRESEHRGELRRKAQVRCAGFPQLLYLENLKRNELPKDMAVALPEQETLDFIKEWQNVIMYGNPGTGKTHCAIGLGIKACLAGYTVLYTSIPHLLTEIRECESQRRLGRLQSKFKKYDLVIGDEFGYKSFDKIAAEALFNHISLRAGIKSMIITTNLGFDHWNEIFSDKIIASAIVDRLTFKSYIIDMNGISFRLKATKEWMDERKKKRNKEK